MVLGKGARNRGAACELIPRALPGVGYQVLDGEQHPTRVRAAWISDHDIDTLATTYPAATHPTDEDTVVIDLTDKTPDPKGQEGRER
jgi:S-DNA-T family DNA segregation ATPase FtsK/SpoIIIE